MTGRSSRPTLRTVAAAAGVSPSLVSFALNDRPGVSAASRRHILEVARELGYQPDPRARELRTGRARLVGLVVRNVTNPFFNGVLTGMQERAEQDDVSIVAMDDHYDAEREAAHVRSLAGRRPMGLAIAPVGEAPVVRLWQKLRPETPLVLLNAAPATHPDVAHVIPDNPRAVRLAVEHLRGLGHRRIALLCAPRELMPDGDRLEAYVAVCAESGMSPAFLHAPPAGEELLRALVAALSAPDRPTAIITNSDTSAAAVYLVAREVGLRIGTDLSVVGHDDLLTSQLLDPPLTTIRLALDELGRQAYLRLVDPQLASHVEPVSLVVRSSTGPPVD